MFQLILQEGYIKSTVIQVWLSAIGHPICLEFKQRISLSWIVFIPFEEEHLNRSINIYGNEPNIKVMLRCDFKVHFWRYFSCLINFHRWPEGLTAKRPEMSTVTLSRMLPGVVMHFVRKTYLSQWTILDTFGIKTKRRFLVIFCIRRCNIPLHSHVPMHKRGST